MSFTIQLPAPIEQHLRQHAAQKGLTIESYIAQLLTEKSTSSKRGKRTEAELLERLQLAVQPSDLEMFYHLSAKFQSGHISADEHEKLLQLNDLIEIAHADRMKYVLEYAKFKGLSLESAMDSLGIKRHLA